MADDVGQTRTEPATPRRREEARKRGQVVFSSDLSSGLLLLAGTGLLWLLGSDFGQKFLWAVRVDLLHIHHVELDTRQASNLLIALMEDGLRVAGAFIGVLFIGSAGIGIIQSGFNVTTEPLSSDWSRLSPMNGWSRMLSMRSTMRTVSALLKLSAIAAIAWWLVKGQSHRIASAGHGTVVSAVRDAWDTTIMGAMAVAAALVLIGLGDYFFQWWKHQEEMKMSRQDVKGEMKQEEGDPLMRGRVKRAQREISQRRSLRDVPTATIVLTNPTHFAVAIKYDRENMSAPRVVAKGRDLFDRRIARIARESGVPVLERKALARVLYAAVDVGDDRTEKERRDRCGGGPSAGDSTQG